LIAVFGKGETLMEKNSKRNREEFDAISRVVEVLDRRIDLEHPHKYHRRSHRRNQFHGRVMLHLPQGDFEDDFTLQRKPILFQAWGRNISRGGMSLLSRLTFNCKEAVVGLLGQDDLPIWIRAEIARTSPAPLGFREYGLVFREKVSERYYSRLTVEEEKENIAETPTEVIRAPHHAKTQDNELREHSGTRIDHSPSMRKSVTRTPFWSVPIESSKSLPD